MLEKMIKAVVFDLGGTLMEYKGMPLNWGEFYYKGFQNVSVANGLNLTDDEITRSVDILKAYNPRNSGRENEIAPEVIFADAVSGWKTKPDISKLIIDFFEGLTLDASIFDHSKDLIMECREKGLRVACLTDLPNGMPDCLFRNAITELEPLFDLYVSSQICGYRKPNARGLEYIADQFGIAVSELLFVGDEKKDELTAENAGCSFTYISEYIGR